MFHCLNSIDDLEFLPVLMKVFSLGIRGMGIRSRAEAIMI